MLNITIACLADQGQVVNGKLYLLGAGWRTVAVPPGMPVSCTIAIMVEVPWAEIGESHSVDVELSDGNGRPMTNDKGGPLISIHGNLQAVRPPGVLLGEAGLFPFVLSIPPLPLAPGKYVWHVVLDGATTVDWELPFTVTAAPPISLAS